MCTYLAKRGSTYYFRRPIPKELRPIFHPKTEWMISLRTKERETAKSRIPPHWEATDKLAAEAREKLKAMMTTETENAPSVASAAHESPVQDVHERFEAATAKLAEEDRLAQELRRNDPVRMAEFERLVRIGRFSTKDLPATDAAMRDFMRMHEEKTAAAERRAEAAEARIPIARSKADAAVADNMSAPELAGKPVRLEPLLEAYADEHGNRAKRGYASSLTHIRSLRDFVVADDARLVTPEQVIEWKDFLLRSEEDGGQGLANKTVRDGYLATIRALFAWAAMNRKIAANPAQGIKVRVPPKEKTRERAFTDAEALKVLAATLIPRTTLSPQYQLACRWIPWLLAYSGARVGEVAQLRAEDVMEVDGVWVMNITPDAGSVKTKKYRYVPLHSHLIDMGFVKVAEDKKTGPLFYDPEAATRQTAKASKSLSEKVGQKVRDMVREVGITPADVEQPNHAWRHRFKTLSRKYGLDSEAAHHIQGHATETDGQDYGSWPVERLAAEIEKLRRYPVPELPEAGGLSALKGSN